MIVSVHVYVPVSEVVRGEKMRLTPIVEIGPSAEVATAKPFTFQTTSVSKAVSTDGLRV